MVTASGGVTSVTVVDNGAGYTKPVVTITGGGVTPTPRPPPTAASTRSRSANPGSGYTFPTVDFDMPDDPNGVQATAHATFDADDRAPSPGIVVDNPGSGYSSAPNVVIRDGTLMDPIINGGSGATATATVNVLERSALDTFGAGYTSAPTVAITDAHGHRHRRDRRRPPSTAVLSPRSTSPPAARATSPARHQEVHRRPARALHAPPGCPTTGKYIPLGVPENKTYKTPRQGDRGRRVRDRPGAVPDLVLVRACRERWCAATCSSRPPANAGISQHFPLTNELLDGTKVPVMQSDGVTQWLAVTPPQ